MVNTPGVAAKVFSLLSEAEIQIMLVTTSDVDISILVSAHELGDAAEALCGIPSASPPGSQLLTIIQYTNK